MIKLQAIAVRAKPKAVMQELAEVNVSLSKGLSGDARGKPGKRQVSLLSSEQWGLACEEVGCKLPWTARRANILVSGMQFGPQHLGQIVCIGDLRMRIRDETEPCIRMERTQTGLLSALMPAWRGGVLCEVLSPGDIKIGDEVTIFNEQLELE
ncbi:MAG: MOSC domain-containing protein YiiM [Pseudomonadales bacterium]|jgi:MOSC domain-containing protein YiiM